MKILQAYATWQHHGGQAEPSPEGSKPEPAEPASIHPERFDSTAAAELLDETKLLPAVWLFVHLAGITSATGDSAGGVGGVGDVARVEGCDPVTAEWVRTHLGQRCRFKITPVLDPLDQVPVDAWEIPHRHRQAVHLLTPADTFPYASNTTRAMQIDHTIPWTVQRAAAGEQQSRVGNYGPMIGFHHRVKTHGDWAVRQPFPGVYVWRDPYGVTYLVDHTGTRRVPQTPRHTSSPLEAHLTRLVLAN